MFAKNRTYRFNKTVNILFSFLLIVFSLFSCVTQRDIEYLHDRQNTQVFNETSFLEYYIKPNDALYIQISSIDDAASNVFAQSSSRETMDAYGAYMNSYTVDKDGYVLLPVIGKINVYGKTTTEVSNMIRDSVTNILSLPTVTVKLVNRYITVLGEVRSPGHYVYSQDKLTIFNAIGLAGDITVYGNRKQVILTRNINGKNVKVNIDLSRADILSSQYYLLQPNDLIYVTSMRKRIWGMAEFPFTLIISSVTTAILIYSFIDQQ